MVNILKEQHFCEKLIMASPHLSGGANPDHCDTREYQNPNYFDSKLVRKVAMVVTQQKFALANTEAGRHIILTTVIWQEFLA